MRGMEKCGEEFSAVLDCNRRITIPKWFLELYNLEPGKAVLHITVRGITRRNPSEEAETQSPTPNPAFDACPKAEVEG